MFKSIKSKLIAITLAIFMIFSLVIVGLEFSEYYRFKISQIENCRENVEKSAKMLEFTISQLENNVRSLALAAASFYFFDRNDRQFADFITKDNFQNSNLNAIGGGIWFEPYVIDKNIKRYCSYASWRDVKTVVNDKDCASENYNYLLKPWYTIVKNNYTSETRNNVTWAKPYYDEIGTKELMLTVGAPIYDKKYKFIGMVGEDWLINSVKDTLESLRPTENSIVVFADKLGDFIITMSGVESDVASYYTGKKLSAIPWYNSEIKPETPYVFNNERFLLYKRDFENGMELIVRVPENELYLLQKKNLIIEILLPFISALILAFLIYLALTKNINKPISVLVEATKELGKGNFDKKIIINKPKEFAQLADTFNKMTTDIQDYLNNIQKLTFEKMEMLSDLNVAKEIQTSSLPNVFPPFPDLANIDLYATMKTAKEVGGDFYDFYFVDSTHIVFSIADVSGKGVPAALFMMKVMSVLKSTALSNPVIETVMAKVNNEILANNDKNFFVTVGLGVIDIMTGEVVYINAGHNPPILKTGSEVKYLSVPTNIVVGVFENVPFEAIKFKLNPLDTIFLYTDGVTEANNGNDELYGEERLLDVLRSDKTHPRILIEDVKKSVSTFINGIEQSDDITMLALTYMGTDNFIETIHVPADISEAECFLNWIEKLCEKCNLADSKKSKVLVSAEEIFVNIANYAYPKEIKHKEQDTIVRFKYVEALGEITLSFTDSGVKYNPLEKEDPDVNAAIEDRNVGGLGILMVKNLMDNVEYEYKNNQNILTLKCYKGKL